MAAIHSLAMEASRPVVTTGFIVKNWFSACGSGTFWGEHPFEQVGSIVSQEDLTQPHTRQLSSSSPIVLIR